MAPTQLVKIVESYCDEFPKKYLSKQVFTHKENSRVEFHLFGQWNILHLEEGNLCLSKMNGGTGEVEHKISEVPFSLLKKRLWIPYKDTFILVFRKRHGFNGLYVSNVIGRLSSVGREEKFLLIHGIKVFRKILVFEKSGLIKPKAVQEVRIDSLLPQH